VQCWRILRVCYCAHYALNSHFDGCGMCASSCQDAVTFLEVWRELKGSGDSPELRTKLGQSIRRLKVSRALLRAREYVVCFVRMCV
jgi:hypothetical protein